MTQHTPGPWHMDEYHDGLRIEPIGFFRETVEADKKDYANARLIAAGPDLLEALKTMTELYASAIEWGWSSPPTDEEYHSALATIANSEMKEGD